MANVGKRIVARGLVAFGAACAGLVGGYLACVVLVLPALGATPSTQHLAVAIATGTAVAGGVASFAVPVDPGDLRLA